MVVTGPFSGDAVNTIFSIGDASCEVIAESPRKGIFRSPLTVVGTRDARISDGNKKATGQIRNIGINLSAPKTTLAKGEKTELTVQVSGLKDIANAIIFRLITTGAVNTQGGNQQTIQIAPSMVDANGVATRTFTLDAVQAGSFNVTANVQTASEKP